MSQFNDAPVPVSQVTGNVSDFDGTKAIIDQVLDEFGHIDVLINNAGINRDRLIMRMKKKTSMQ